MTKNDNSWIKLNRSITSHWLWEDDVYSRGQAFIDLLIMAAYADHKSNSQGRLMTIKRGSMITSIRHLSDRWGWSKDKVSRFLACLEEDEIIKKESDTKRTVLTIVNYDKYQGIADTERTQNGRKTDTKRTQNGQTKERKERKEGKRNIFYPPSADDVKKYCDENGFHINQNLFVDFYTSRNWYSGKTKITDWKAVVRMWEQNKEVVSVQNTKNRFNNFEQRNRDFDELEEMLLTHTRVPEQGGN